MSAFETTFKSPRWLKGPHSQTLYTNRLRRISKVDYNEERLEMPDGDFIDVFWYGHSNQPWVVCLPGIFGSKDALYIRGAVHTLNRHGLGCVVVHYRGAHGVLNRLPQVYHSGATDVPFFILSVLKERFPNQRYGVLGFSLGACLTLNMLLEDDTDITSAAVISAPTDLYSCVRQTEKPDAWLYRKNFMKRLHSGLVMKASQLRPLGLDVDAGFRAQTVFEFDDAIIAPLHGFSGAEDYYEKCSTHESLKDIAKPTCFISSYDDPVLGEECYPASEDVSDSVQLHLTDTGGHVGFLQGVPWKPDYWAERTAIAFLAQQLVSADSPK